MSSIDTYSGNKLCFVGSYDTWSKQQRMRCMFFAPYIYMRSGAGYLERSFASYIYAHFYAFRAGFSLKNRQFQA